MNLGCLYKFFVWKVKTVHEFYETQQYDADINQTFMKLFGGEE